MHIFYTGLCNCEVDMNVHNFVLRAAYRIADYSEVRVIKMKALVGINAGQDATFCYNEAWHRNQTTPLTVTTSQTTPAKRKANPPSTIDLVTPVNKGAGANSSNKGAPANSSNKGAGANKSNKGAGANKSNKAAGANKSNKAEGANTNTTPKSKRHKQRPDIEQFTPLKHVGPDNKTTVAIVSQSGSPVYPVGTKLEDMQLAHKGRNSRSGVAGRYLHNKEPVLAVNNVPCIVEMAPRRQGVIKNKGLLNVTSVKLSKKDLKQLKKAKKKIEQFAASHVEKLKDATFCSSKYHKTPPEHTISNAEVFAMFINTREIPSGMVYRACKFFCRSNETVFQRTLTLSIKCV